MNGSLERFAGFRPHDTIYREIFMSKYTTIQYSKGAPAPHDVLGDFSEITYQRSPIERDRKRGYRKRGAREA